LPDGLLGKPMVVVGAGYSSSSGSEKTSGDFHSYWARCRIPMQDRTCLHFSWNLRTRDSNRYEFTGGLKFYSADPLSGPVNPDGRIMRPVVIVDGGFRFYDNDTKNGYWLGDASLQLPASHHLTITGGYRFYEEEEPLELIDYYGRVNVYFASYSESSRFSNPDGPPGYLALGLTGGGSSAGHMGEARVLLPLNRSTTVAVVGWGEWFDDPSQKALSAGFELSVYP
jgi:hypothetical protein